MHDHNEKIPNLVYFKKCNIKISRSSFCLFVVAGVHNTFFALRKKKPTILKPTPYMFSSDTFEKKKKENSKIHV